MAQSKTKTTRRAPGSSDGKAKGAAKAKLPDEASSRELLSQMALIRRFEEEAGRQYQRAKAGGFLHLAIGEEATIVGTTSVMRPDDYLIGTYRTHGHAIARGTDPKVLAALNPVYAVRFFLANGTAGFLVLGAVFLVATGGEALYADLGHFHERAIQIDWFSLVAPCLLLNYFGQGALVLGNPAAADNPFYLLAPSWGHYPLLLLSTMAAIIASQAIISGAFSLTRQAVQLGYLPRLHIQHTSASQEGQIFVPQVNTLLMVATVAVVIGFKTSSNVASAYGVALTATMLITTLLAFLVTRRLWGWPLWLSVLVTGVFLMADTAFFGSMIVKLFSGGWFPLAMGALVFLIMSTWRRGRSLLAKKIDESLVPLVDFFELMNVEPTIRVPGTAVFMTSNPRGTPPALLNNFLHNHTVHETVLLLTVVIEEMAHVPDDQRVKVEQLENGFTRIIAHYGFMERADIVALFARTDTPSPPLEYTTFFIGNEIVLPEGRSRMNRWRMRLFAFLARNAVRPTAFFNIPPQRLMEIGSQVKM